MVCCLLQLNSDFSKMKYEYLPLGTSIKNYVLSVSENIKIVRIMNAPDSPINNSDNDFVYLINGTETNTSIYGWRRIIAFDVRTDKIYTCGWVNNVISDWKSISNLSFILNDDIHDALNINNPAGMYSTTPETLNLPISTYGYLTISKDYYGNWILVTFNPNDLSQSTYRNFYNGYGSVGWSGWFKESDHILTENVTIYMGNINANQLFFPQGDFNKPGYNLVGIVQATTTGGNNYTNAVMLDWTIQNGTHIWSRGYNYANGTAENITVHFTLLYTK